MDGVLRALLRAHVALLLAYAAGAMPAIAQEIPPSPPSPPPPPTPTPPPPVIQSQVPSGIASISSTQSTANVLSAVTSVGISSQPVPPSASPSAGVVQRMIQTFMTNLVVTLNQSIAQQQTLMVFALVGPPGQRQSAAAQLAVLNQKIALLQTLVRLIFDGRLDLEKLSPAQLTSLAEKLQLLNANAAGQPQSTSTQLKDAFLKLQQQINDLQQAESKGKGAQPFASEASLADSPPLEAMAYAMRRQPVFAESARIDLAAPAWLAWTQAMGTSVDIGGAAPANGRTGQGIGGIEYRFSPLFAVGATIGGERSRFNTLYNGGYFNGSGATIAPYARFQLAPNVQLNVLGGTSFLTMDLSDGMRTAHLDATRPFVSASLLGTWYHDAWRFSPSASVIAGELRSDAAVNSDGTPLPAANTRFGRVSAGPELGYALPVRYGTVEPFAFAALEHDFGDTSNSVVANGTVFAPGTQGVRVGGGLKIMSFYGWSGVASASYKSIGWRDQNSWTGSARLEWKF